MPQYINRFNQKQRYAEIEKLVATVKDAQDIQDAVASYPAALEQLVNYTRDNEKKDKAGEVIRKAGSFQQSIHNTFTETFTKYTQKALESMDIDSDFQSIYRSLETVLNQLHDKSFLETWNTEYAAKLRSIGEAQLENRHTIADMIGTDDYQKIARGLSALRDPTPLHEWETQYADKVITSLSEELPTIDKLEDIHPRVEQAREVLGYLPDPESITYKPWKQFTYLDSASATYTVNALHQHNMYKNLSNKIKQATSPEEAAKLISTINEEPYKQILSSYNCSNLGSKYCLKLYQLGREAILKNLENVSPQQAYNKEDREEFAAITNQYISLLSEQSIETAINSGNNQNSWSMYSAHASAFDYRTSLDIYASYVDMIFQMQAATNAMELQEVVITGRELFPHFPDITFDFHINVNLERPHKQMETECVLYYCEKLVTMAIDTIEKTDSLDELWAHYDQAQALLNRIDSLFYPDSKEKYPVTFEASSGRNQLREQFEEICLSRQDEIIEKKQLEEKDNHDDPLNKKQA